MKQKRKNKDHAFFGQPQGLSTLFFTEMWERFSYYGMRAILLFYMYYAVNRGGLGLNQVTAASIMSIYGSLVYLSTMVGGWLIVFGVHGEQSLSAAFLSCWVILFCPFPLARQLFISLLL